MKKIIIFGAGPTGKRAYAFYREFCDVVAYADNNEISAVYLLFRQSRL